MLTPHAYRRQTVVGCESHEWHDIGYGLGCWPCSSYAVDQVDIGAKEISDMVVEALYASRAHGCENDK